MKTGYEIILEYAKNKEVLDIGSCGCQGLDKKMPILYNKLKEVAKDVIGIDIEGQGEIIKANAETFDLKKKFDLIVAGDVIEHMSNPGLFLDNMYNHLKDDGKMIITTPNVATLSPFVYDGNFYHTCWYCYKTIEYLLAKHNFKVLVHYKTIRNKRNPVLDLIKKTLMNHLVVIASK